MDLRYPVGPFVRPAQVSDDERAALVDEVAALPDRLAAAVIGLDELQLDTPYREGGWTVRQVTHHVADSHVNAYTRFRLALTEDVPTIRPYDETRWAVLADAQRGPVGPSLALLAALHSRWTQLLRSLAPADFARRLHHPETGTHTLDQLLATYAWHGRHHVAHVTALRERMRW
jgi:hypothetical protein